MLQSLTQKWGPSFERGKLDNDAAIAHTNQPENGKSSS